MKKQLISGIVIFGLLILPPIRVFLESIMIAHMLIQMPLLIVAGALLDGVIIERYDHLFSKWDTDGVASILIVLFVTLYWMLPRTMDEALSLWFIELFKFISLPIVGIALRYSWIKLRTVGKSFIFLNYISMFAMMSWIYIDAPMRVCNNYLEDEQKILGWGFLVITLFMLIYLLQLVFLDRSQTKT